MAEEREPIDSRVDDFDNFVLAATGSRLTPYQREIARAMLDDSGRTIIFGGRREGRLYLKRLASDFRSEVAAITNKT